MPERKSSQKAAPTKFLQPLVRQDGDGGLVLLVAWRRCRVLPAHQFLLICIFPDMGIA